MHDQGLIRDQEYETKRLFNLAGVGVLFVFGMPFRIATGGKTVTWTTSSIDVQVKKLDDIYTVLGWIGLLAILFGTPLQIMATLQPRR